MRSSALFFHTGETGFLITAFSPRESFCSSLKDRLCFQLFSLGSKKNILARRHVIINVGFWIIIYHTGAQRLFSRLKSGIRIKTNYTNCHQGNELLHAFSIQEVFHKSDPAGSAIGLKPCLLGLSHRAVLAGSIQLI